MPRPTPRAFFVGRFILALIHLNLRMKTRKGYITGAILYALMAMFSAFTGFDAGKASNSLTGAWGFEEAGNKNVMLFSGNVFSVAAYNFKDKKFNSSYGGTWHVENGKLMRKIEWHSKDSTQVGKEWSHNIQLSDNKLAIATVNEKWQRLDDGGPGALAGVWVITGNYNNDKVSKRANPFFPRRTMKILSGKYFHWVAYNVTSKQFLNAGGGSYTTSNDQYTENIEFFTKTPESIGKSLVFAYSFVDGDWRHKGQKSTGGALDECWTKRQVLEN
jgi:hypothetical protein